MISVDNLDDTLKQRYKSLAVFLDDNSVPKKVNFLLRLGTMFRIQLLLIMIQTKEVYLRCI